MEHAMMEDDKVMYETMLIISQNVEIMYEALQKETEEKERLQRQFPDTEEALEALKHNSQSLQVENGELKMLLQEEKEEKHSLLQQMQVKEEALEKLQHDPCEIKSCSSSSCMFPHDDFVVFGNHTTGIGSKLLKKMGYEGKGLGIKGQRIVNPIKVEELPCQAGLGYVRKEVGESTKTDSKPPTTDDEQPSLILSNSTRKVKDVDFPSISSSHSMISVGDVEILITGKNMRLLTRMRYKGEEELGVNNQGITQPLEVVQRPRFAGLGYTEGECSKVLDSSKTSSKSLRKENDGYTSPSSHGSVYCRERVEASSHRHNDTRDGKERYNQCRYSNVHFDYNHVVNDERKTWNRKTCTFCGLYNHTFSKCWKRITAHKRKRHERPSQQQVKKHVKQI